MNELKYNESQKNRFPEYLKHHNAKNNANGTHTHTRIGSNEHNIYGGSYSIVADELPAFYRLYYQHVFVQKQKEYLTEKQLLNNGPLLVDFDFRYDSLSITRRQHTESHISDMVEIYLDELKKMVQFEDNVTFPIFIMEKPNMNVLADGTNVTKDGIHMIIGIQLNRTLQKMLREQVMVKLEEAWDLPITNSYEQILDEGITKGTTNWQLYGSRKPGNEAYKLTYYITATIDESDNEFMTEQHNISEFDIESNLSRLSAQYANHPIFQITPEYDKKCKELIGAASGARQKVSGSSGKGKVRLIHTTDEEDDINIADIVNMEMLEKAVNKMLNKLPANEFRLREIHEYTQILPKKYFEPGSHRLNRMVAFALKSSHECMFLSWILLRSKAEDFQFSRIPDLYVEWVRNFNKTPGGITYRSILYWAKQDAYDEYMRVRQQTCEHIIDQTILDATDVDFATVLHHMYKDRYVCTDLNSKKWYVFKNHRWVEDRGQTLRFNISREMFDLYQKKTDQYSMDVGNYEANTPEHDKLQKKIRRVAEVSIKLKKTTDKNNIMREAMEVFFDSSFSENLDENPWLMCFSNGVVDFKEKIFRDGYPQDYISKSTGTKYIGKTDLEENVEYKEMATEIQDFMAKIFPVEDTRMYMWNHLAASLIGVKKEEAFNIYCGSGSNGKSKLTGLMTKSLGTYTGTVPISLVTDKRRGIGGTSSEIHQLKGVRYAVMQEPTKGDPLNEGVVKELTGNDMIQARALYKESESFYLQLSLVVCTNSMFEIRSNDDGTWRRLKQVDFVSKFVGNVDNHTDDTKYVFPKDYDLDTKFQKWAPIFASMLTHRAFETDGMVQDCEAVTQATRAYRVTQDYLGGFILEKVVSPAPGKTIKKRELNEEFKMWFQNIYGNRRPPKLTELTDMMVKKFGALGSNNMWKNIAIKYEEDCDVDENI
jgi:P4 family phage/plasmid primase-like protien